MKKLLAITLITALLLGNAPTYAGHHSHGHGGNVLSGVWQVIKIGGGFVMIGGSLAVSLPLCGLGGALKCCHEDCLNALECQSRSDAESCRQCGNCAVLGGLGIGGVGTYCGYRSIKSGIHGLRRLAHKKHKGYKHHS